MSREKVIEGSREKIGANKVRYKGGKKESQDEGKAVIRYLNLEIGAVWLYLVGSPALDHCSIIQDLRWSLLLWAWHRSQPCRQVSLGRVSPWLTGAQLDRQINSISRSGLVPDSIHICPSVLISTTFWHKPCHAIHATQTSFFGCCYDQIRQWHSEEKWYQCLLIWRGQSKTLNYF